MESSEESGVESSEAGPDRVSYSSSLILFSQRLLRGVSGGGDGSMVVVWED